MLYGGDARQVLGDVLHKLFARYLLTFGHADSLNFGWLDPRCFLQLRHELLWRSLGLLNVSRDLKGLAIHAMGGTHDLAATGVSIAV